MAFTLWKKINSSNSRLFNAIMSFGMINCFCPNNWWITLLITLAFAKIVALFAFLITNIATADGLQKLRVWLISSKIFSAHLGISLLSFQGCQNNFKCKCYVGRAWKVKLECFVGLVIAITFYSPSCLGQETTKGPFGLRVKLPPAHVSTTHGGGFILSL